MCTVLPPGVNPVAVNKYININIKTEEEDEEGSDDDDNGHNDDDDNDNDDEKQEQNNMRITTRHVVTQYVITTDLHYTSCLGYSLFLGYDALTLGNWFPTFQHNVDLFFKVRMSKKNGLSVCSLV
jgi:hypothetical protein